MEEEIFKDIPGYDGLYQASNLGRVKSLSKEKLNQGKKLFISKEIILKPLTGNNRYYIVRLTKNSKIKTHTIHQLVAISFLSHTKNITTKIVVDHINNNPLDNRVENLQLISHRENISKDQKNKTSKYTGVSWCSERKKWRSSIFINKLINLGRFNTEIEAHEAYQNKLKEIQNESR